MHYAFLGIALLALVACGGASSSGIGSSAPAVPMPSINTIDELPYASAMVVTDEDDADSAQRIRSVNNGVTLSEMSAADFSSDSSYALCRTAADFRSAMSEAGALDELLCYAQNTLPGVRREGLDLYGSDANQYTLYFSQTGRSLRVRTKIRRRSGLIETFQMWVCDESAQIAYLQQQISGNVLTLSGKYVDEDRTHEIDVSGTLNGDGEFLTKSITSAFDKTWSNGRRYGERTLVLTPDEATISLWDNGYWTDEDGQVPFENVAYAAFELAGGDDLGTLAVGEGAARGESSGGEGAAAFDESFVEGWSAQSFARDVTTEFIVDVENVSTPSVGSPPDGTFVGDEAFNCIGQSYAAEVNEAEIGIFCSDKSLDEEWLNCWDIVQNGNGGGNQPEESVMGESCVTFTDCDSLGSGAVCVNTADGRMCSLICDADSDCSAYGDFECGADSVCVALE